MVDRSSSWPGTSRRLVRGGAVLGPVLTCAVLAGFRHQVPAATAVLVLVLWVVAAAATGDRPAGVVAALAGAVSFDYFLTAPYHRLAISGSGDVQTTVLLVLISLAVTELALWGRRQQASAARRSGYLAGVVDTARSVAEGDVPASALTDLVGRQVREVLEADEARFVEGPVHDVRIAVLDHDGGLTRNGHPVDVDRVGLPTDEYVAVLVRRGDQQVGHYLVTSTSRVARPSREQRRVAVLLADQVAAALA